MAQIEKSVFISYRRTNIFHARATFQDLRANDYDVFMDYETMNAGDFEQIILNQIKARAHFLVILTPSALERCHEPNDWLRREIETALDYKRNIIPLMFDGFDWNSVQKYLTGKLAVLSNYNSLKIPAEYFDEAMNRLRTRFLSVPIDTVLHPTPKTDASALAQKMEMVINQPSVTEAQLTASEYFERGFKYAEIGEYDKAMQDFNETIRLNPQDALAYYNRGVVYSKKSQFVDAISDYDEAIRLNPQDALIYNNRGNAYINIKEYSRAISDLNVAIRLNPHYARAYLNRGNAYSNIGDKKQAIQDYDEAIRLSPNYALAYNNRGYEYLHDKKYKRALHDFMQAIKINPQDANVYDSLGEYYLHIGDYDSALANFDKALELDPNFEYAQRNRNLAIQKKRNINKG